MTHSGKAEDYYFAVNLKNFIVSNFVERYGIDSNTKQFGSLYGVGLRYENTSNGPQFLRLRPYTLEIITISEYLVEGANRVRPTTSVWATESQGHDRAIEFYRTSSCHSHIGSNSVERLNAGKIVVTSRRTANAPAFVTTSALIITDPLAGYNPPNTIHSLMIRRLL